jgi:hypothetical protein
MHTWQQLDIVHFHDAEIFPGKVGDKLRKRHLSAACDLAKVSGYTMEFGVFNGYTLNALARHNNPETVWGFDSFQGLPEFWNMHDDQGLAAGYFAIDKLPCVEPNAKLVVGWFNDTLPSWLSENLDPVRLLHIDCDIYSSAFYVLDALNSRILPGTVIVFDDFYAWHDPGSYTNWHQGEYLALKHWMERYNREIEIIYRTDYFQCSILVRK